ncbi:MAG: bis(5'-nucleosyl)-tetraphosphatase (symmetrical) YqeK [Calothrix sp. C42_A2020_038]|nr:bis(5'-nucleosyl)-tetraphosphatase (symmetrical) YqeK [Calothrix sp. C42_A2020_038]
MREQVLAWLAKNVPSNRIEHILRVEQMSVSLALLHNLNCEKAAASAIMHDLAKYFPGKRLLQMARTSGIEVDEVLESNPHLLHADVGAIIARDTFGVTDPEILQAIANHTLGRPAMSRLCCVVFLADSLEPGRGDTDELQILRSEASTSLEKAIWLTCNHTINHLIERHCVIHPRVITTRNWFLTKSRQSIGAKST